MSLSSTEKRKVTRDGLGKTKNEAEDSPQDPDVEEKVHGAKYEARNDEK
jgi:hypothetical protein